ncbi:other 1 kinase [Pyrrhoderma noxium]|uniref:Other 1 kinase n=1 Tax=Pyrrhoderma noxium TaxID=2282107 RepID=A0A286UK90_9AGAM|nr:other 1 kinase [Pyrrhoderma noxium]
MLMKELIHERIERTLIRQASSETYGQHNKRDYVLKQSYPLNGGVHGADIIFRARKALNNVDDDMSKSRSGSKKYSDSLPLVYRDFEIDNRNKILRGFCEANNYGGRVLRFIISERLEPITSLTDLEEFKTAFRDIFHVIHYLAISKDGIIHRDINISNLMYRRLEDDSVQGVLNDWDVASTSHTESDSEHTNMHTGTMPFMSIDLHEDPPPVHMERFEYESLFYVLYWICLSYSDGKLLPEEKRHSAFKRWPRWNSNDHDDVSEAKIGLKANETIFENVNEFPAMYRPLIRPWLRLLRHTLRRGYNARHDARFAGKLAEFDNDTLGRYVSYESIHKILES